MVWRSERQRAAHEYDMASSSLRSGTADRRRRVYLPLPNTDPRRRNREDVAWPHCQLEGIRNRVVASVGSVRWRKPFLNNASWQLLAMSEIGSRVKNRRSGFSLPVAADEGFREDLMIFRAMLNAVKIAPRNHRSRASNVGG